ncbi:MAG: LysR family transcriptional regulator, partial [Verrucomicrobia bacterium]|nr:LysR family transcriptional regulator [Verrucomicrobiota bacterium]
MQIETFKIFRDLVETASFSKAAELNAITQSAVSQQIRALEKRFKTALIRRRNKNFSITPEGKALLQASQEILRTYETLGDRLEELKNHVSGNLIIATVHSIGLHELPRSLKLFRRTYPSVDVSVEYLRSAQVYQSVAAGSSDVGLVAYPARHRG